MHTHAVGKGARKACAFAVVACRVGARSDVLRWVGGQQMYGGVGVKGHTYRDAVVDWAGRL